MADNVWAEASWIVRQIENSSGSGVQGNFIIPPNNIPMKKIKSQGIDGYHAIWFTWPEDNYLENILIAPVNGVKGVLHSNEDDLGDPATGIELFDSRDPDEHSTYDKAFILKGESLKLTEGATYWIQLYPYSAEGLYNTNVENAIKFTYYAYKIIYGLRVDKTNSDPFTRVEYLEGYMNENYDSAYMDYDNDVFNYGDWADDWFVRDIKPCILNLDGDVTYLNPNNYNYDEVGNLVDITTAQYLQVMIEIPRVWLYTYEAGDYQYYFFSNSRISNNYYAYAHTAHNTDINGATGTTPYIYIGAYQGYYDSRTGALYSLSGKTLKKESFSNLFNYSDVLNVSNVFQNWSLCTFAQRQLINALLLLIGRSTDGQTTFGYGSTSATATGTLDDKGLFYCASGTSTSPVKVFGIENYWGSAEEFILGCFRLQGVTLVKLTYGTQDGSAIEGYYDSGWVDSDYVKFISVANGITSNITTAKYISESYVNKYGWFPSAAAGSASTYECDAIKLRGTGNDTYKFYSLRMGGVSSTLQGPYYCNWYDLVTASTACNGRLSYTSRA